MNCRRIGISLAVYIGSLLIGFAIIMLGFMVLKPGDDVTGGMVMPFLIFLYPAMNELRGNRQRVSSVATQLVGVAGILAIVSISTCVANFFLPDRISTTTVLIGAPLSIAIIYPLFWVRDRIVPQQDLSA